jgi:hypothetical protein
MSFSSVRLRRALSREALPISRSPSIGTPGSRGAFDLSALERFLAIRD